MIANVAVILLHHHAAFSANGFVVQLYLDRRLRDRERIVLVRCQHLFALISLLFELSHLRHSCAIQLRSGAQASIQSVMPGLGMHDTTTHYAATTRAFRLLFGRGVPHPRQNQLHPCLWKKHHPPLLWLLRHRAVQLLRQPQQHAAFACEISWILLVSRQHGGRSQDSRDRRRPHPASIASFNSIVDR